MPADPYVAEVADGLYKIQSVLSGKNLEISAGSLDNGGLLSQWSNNGYNNQIFEVQNTETGSYIVSTESQKALGIGSYNDGTKIIQVDKRINISQRFKINKSKKLREHLIYKVMEGHFLMFSPK